MKIWREQVTDREAYCRAGGRRRYNMVRHAHAQERKKAVKEAIRESKLTHEIAESLALRFGVSEATIWCDWRESKRKSGLGFELPDLNFRELTIRSEPRPVNSGQWQPGQSGNPQGSSKMVRETTKLRQEIDAYRRGEL